MKVKKRILFSKEDHADLLPFLLNQGISFNDNHVATIEMYDDHIAWPAIETYVTENDLLCLSETIFTKTELENAEWLRVRRIRAFNSRRPSQVPACSVDA